MEKVIHLSCEYCYSTFEGEEADAVSLIIVGLAILTVHLGGRYFQ